MLCDDFISVKISLLRLGKPVWFNLGQQLKGRNIRTNWAARKAMVPGEGMDLFICLSVGHDPQLKELLIFKQILFVRALGNVFRTVENMH